MVEQILAFVLGVSSVFLIWGVVVAFKTASKVKELIKYVKEIQIIIDKNEELINRRVDQEIDRVNQLHTESIKYIDSRVDKLEAKLETKFNDIMERDSELRLRINKTAELINDIAGLNIKK